MQRITAVLSAVLVGVVLAGPVSAETAKKGPVTCNDGTTSPHGGQGACSGHGGIKKAAKETKTSKKKTAPAEAPAATQSTPAAPMGQTAPSAAKPSTGSTAAKSHGNTDPSGATARCKDGTYSHSKTHQGACSKHGGVAEWLDGTGKK
jgi:hypothetical protein